MPAKTNLNVFPYFDDFDDRKNYYRILFKPGYPVQARELSSVQSILQNQIEQFGNHVFKEGSVVIPGNISFTRVAGVKVENTFNGINVDSYLDDAKLYGAVIRGRDSGLRAKVVRVLKKQDYPDLENTLVYLQYLNTGINNESTFAPGEPLIAESDIIPIARRSGGTTTTTVSTSTQNANSIYGDPTVSSSNPSVTTTTASSRSSISGQYIYGNVNTLDDVTIRGGEEFLLTNFPIYGAAAIVSEGIYFLRGHFVNVNEELLIVDRFNYKTTCKIGLEVIEEIITSDEDSSLFDNSKGFSNFAAPGADRLKISARLARLDIDDNRTDNFVELTRVIDGVIEFINRNPDYNELGKEFARRTYDESGDYYVKPFTVGLEESFNDLEGSQGAYKYGELTRQGNTPSESKGVYKISPGKAYVKGFEIERISSSLLDFNKPRETETLRSQSVQYYTGSTFSLNRVHGSPNIGISTYTVSLRDSRVGLSDLESSGKEIGLSRVYDFALESGSYTTSNLNLNEWDISLYDIDLYTELTLSEPITISAPSRIDGRFTGSYGYLRYNSANSGIVTVYSSSGSFSIGEKIDFDNGETRVVTNIRKYGVDDIKSVFGQVGVSTFNADLKQYNKISLGEVTISAESGGISTVTSSNVTFTNFCEDGDLVSFTASGNTIPTYAKVITSQESSITISGVTTVTGITEGYLPNTTISTPDFRVLTSKSLSYNYLYTPLPKPFVSSLDLTNSSLVIRRQFDVVISSGSFNIAAGTLNDNEVFLPYDEERYSLVTNSGITVPLEQGNIVLSNGGRELTATDLSYNGNAKLIATLNKLKITSIQKKPNPAKTLTISKSKLSQSGSNSSGIGATTLNDGLEYGNYPYGTRVQDNEICLNVPEVNRIYAVYESRNSQDPDLPKVLITDAISENGSPVNANSIQIGERLYCQASESVFICVSVLNPSTIEVAPVNNKIPSVGESIRFGNTNIQATLSNYEPATGLNIIDRYELISGETRQIYGYSFLRRKSQAASPKRRLKVVYDSRYIPSTDTGDITCANTYSEFDRKTVEVIDSGLSSSRKQDYIDIRPIVDEYSPITGSRSPFEFLGRTFSSTGNSTKDILASDESILFDFSYYLGRVDRIFMDINEQLIVKEGVPSNQFDPPEAPANAIEIARITLPPYMDSVKQASISLLDYKRYRMSDIAKLEKRIKNLEYYTTLSLLEQNTASLSVKDENGLDRFKSGFFVDDFGNRVNQYNPNNVKKNSIDKINRELRPSVNTVEIDLTLATNSNYGVSDNIQVSPVTGLEKRNYDNVQFIGTSNIIGNNVRVYGGNGPRNEGLGKGVLTLAYNEQVTANQAYATRVVNVTPYLVTNYYGQLDLNPSSDIWSQDTILEPLLITGIEGRQIEESFEFTADEFASQDGWDPVNWGSWQNNWTGTSTQIIGTETRTTTSSSRGGSVQQQFFDPATVDRQTQLVFGLGANQRDTALAIIARSGLVGSNLDNNINPIVTRFGTNVTTTTTTGNIVQTTNTGTATQSGNTTRITNPLEDKDLGNRVVEANLALYLRSRNIEYLGRKLKPATRMYVFFDDQDVTELCTPKLLEIEMVGGVFTPGEDLLFLDSSGNQRALYRCAPANHQYGDINNPDAQTFYFRNPYDLSILPTSYSASSTILNLDTTTSGDISSGYYGNVLIGYRIEGLSSGAVATVTNKRIYTDGVGVTQGSLFIPNPRDPVNQRFTTGTISFKLTNDRTNNLIIGVETSEAIGQFTSQGLITQSQETTISVRNTLIETATISREREIVSTSTTFEPVSTTETTVFVPPPQPPFPPRRHDPLAQSFFTPTPSGICVTSIDIYFQAKSEDLPVFIELRSMELGLPTTEVYPFSRVELLPEQVNVSDDASVPTKVFFQAPVYLEGNKEHCVVLLSDVTDYYVWIQRLGEVTTNVEGEEITITTQSTLGSLFKSQNGSSWTPSQYEDLKYTLYTAFFVDNGSVSIVNPDISALNNLYKDPLNTDSRRIRVGLGTTVADNNLKLGNTIYQTGSNGSGNYVGNAGIATGNLSITNAGIGYTPFAFGEPAFTFTDVPLVSLTGLGENATADITIDGGVAIAATITTGGSGYVVGEELTVSQLGISSVGRNLRLSVSNIYGINELILEDVQGEFDISNSKPLYFDSNDPVVGFGTTTINGLLNGGNGSSVNITSINTVNDGLHIRVRHKNHGMHSPANKVIISGVEPDSPPARTAATLSSDSTDDIPLTVDDISIFEQFENVGVSTENLGYISIGNEIISYTGVSGNSLTGITRNVTGSSPEEYTPAVVFEQPIGKEVRKYEYNGISLRRINKVHFLQDATIENPIDLDSYTIKIDTSTDGVDRSVNSPYPKLFFNETKNGGGEKIYGSKNISYELIHPMIGNLVLPDTNLTATIRTTTGTSIDGNEESFRNAGTQPLTLNEDNYFDSPRIVASRTNELAFADQLPGNKSMEITLNLSTSQRTVSPFIDLDRLAAIFVSNRVNAPVSNYITDSRVTTIQDDPTAFTYHTKPIELEFAATSIRVIVSAHVNQYTDVRAFYAIMNSPNEEPIYYPFPGYRNRISSGQVIDVSLNDGTPDKLYSNNSSLGYVSGDLSFIDLEFNVDNLEPFNFFSIKLLGTSTNQAFPPRFRDLRVIGLA